MAPCNLHCPQKGLSLLYDNAQEAAPCTANTSEGKGIELWRKGSLPISSDFSPINYSIISVTVCKINTFVVGRMQEVLPTVLQILKYGFNFFKITFSFVSCVMGVTCVVLPTQFYNKISGTFIISRANLILMSYKYRISTRSSAKPVGRWFAFEHWWAQTCDVCYFTFITLFVYMSTWVSLRRQRLPIAGTVISWELVCPLGGLIWTILWNQTEKKIKRPHFGLAT